MTFSEAAAEALYEKDRAALERALAARPDLGAPEDEGGLTLLHIAASAWNGADVICLLLAAGAPIDAQDCLGRTPLYMAVLAGHIDNVRALLDAGADANRICTKNDTTALFRAVYVSRADIALLLLPHSTDVNIEAKDDGGTPLLWAVGSILRSWCARWWRAAPTSMRRASCRVPCPTSGWSMWRRCSRSAPTSMRAAATARPRCTWRRCGATTPRCAGCSSAAPIR